MKRYRVVLRWTGPKPALNKAGLATYVIDVTDDDNSVRQAVRCARLIAPRTDSDVPCPHWEPTEVWEQIPLYNWQGEPTADWETDG